MITKVIFTIRYVKLVEKKEFTIGVFNLEEKTYNMWLILQILIYIFIFLNEL